MTLEVVLTSILFITNKFFHIIKKEKIIYFFYVKFLIKKKGFARLWTEPNISKHELTTAMQHLFKYFKKW